MERKEVFAMKSDKIYHFRCMLKMGEEIEIVFRRMRHRHRCQCRLDVVGRW